MQYLEHRRRTSYTLAAQNLAVLPRGFSSLNMAVLSKTVNNRMSRQVETRRNTGSTIPRPNFGWVIFRQLGLILIIGLLVLPLSVNVSFSFVVGALIHVLPQALFALTAFLHMGARNIKKAYMSISQGMVAKFLLTAAALITVFKFWPSISLTALFIGYLLLQISSWILYPILINRPLSGGK